MKNKLRFLFVFAFFMLIYGEMRSSAAADTHRQIVVEGDYKFSLYYSRAIQGYCEAGDYVYIQQAYNKNEFEEFEAYQTGKTENLILLTRCLFSPDEDAYVPEDYMLLSGVGHGQTLDVYDYKGKTYLFVSAGSISSGSKNLWWSSQLGRIEYVPYKYMKNSEIERLTYVNYANKKGKRFGSTKRADGALSPDKKTMLLWKINEKGESELTGYDFEAVNRELDKAVDRQVKAQGNKALRKAVLFSVSGVKLPHRSFQGFAISNGNNGRYDFYISSGDERYYRTGNSIHRYTIKGSKISHKTSVSLEEDDIWIMYLEEPEKTDTTEEPEYYEEMEGESEIEENIDEYIEEEGVLAEIEDLKIFGIWIQFILRNTGNPNQQIMCTIPLSELN